MRKLSYIIIFAFMPLITLTAQVNDIERFIQVTGIITDESDNPVPNVGVISTLLKRGSMSDRSGVYSVVSAPGDTLIYRALGFKVNLAFIPASAEGRHMTIDVVLYTDTIPIEDVTILPWKTYDEFRRDVTQPRQVDPVIENMNENLASVYASISSSSGVTITPEAGFRYAMEQNFNAMATRNQYPVNNLLNPFAWSKFLKGIRNGLLRNQKDERPANNKARPKKKKKSPE